MNDPVIWALVGAGLGVVVVRRRSAAVALVTAQALALVVLALSQATTRSDVLAAVALAIRAVALATLLLVLVARTREQRPVRAGVSPFLRAGFAIALALTFSWAIPDAGLAHRRTEEAVLALAAFGLVTAATRRATLFQVLGIVLLENGLALGALSQAGGSSAPIELGVIVDLVLIAVVAGVFHERIFAEFGAGDVWALRNLRD
jgi:hydrogenase-4 component E